MQETAVLPTEIPKSRDKLATVALTGVAILVGYVLFTLLTLPHAPGFRILAINKDIFETVARTISSDWKRLLWPMEYEPGRIYWPPTTIFFTYAGEKYLGPLASYLLFSSLFIASAFVLAFVVTRSLLFSATLGFMFAFGTQLNYAYTHGGVLGFYVLLSYVAINLSIVGSLLIGRVGGKIWLAMFVLSLVVLALSNEMWINYAVALCAAAGFGIFWARRHDHRSTMRLCSLVVFFTLVVLAAYLLVRLQFVGQFAKRGEEEELVVYYSNPVLMVEDFITNYFTFLYTTLSNYFPSFITASNSLAYLGPERILAEQYGYHKQYENLVVMSHLFMWQFYAGVATTLFAGVFVLVAVRAWRRNDFRYAIILALMLMVATGFATHLLIKMRPYNSVPMLPYKVAISLSALTVLISYLVMISRDWFRSVTSHRVLVVCVWGSVFLAALTRPGMQGKMLSQVGLLGLRDPLGQIMNLFR